ncbi:TetR/AcrR family transcriptional regulator [Thermodesulfobacteriota bacterium]
MVENKRDRILDASFDKFKQYGFVKTTVDEIARHAHVGKGTIYFYFKSKEDILLALVDREMDKGYREIANAMGKKHDAADQLKMLLQVTFDFFHGNELVSKVMAMDQGFVLSVIYNKNKEMQENSMMVIRQLLEQGQKEGTFRELDYDKVAYIIDSLIRSFHYLHYLDLTVYDPKDIIEPLIDLLSTGLENH